MTSVPRLAHPVARLPESPAQLDRVVAALAAVAIGSHLSVFGQLTLSLVVPAVLLPIWLPGRLRAQYSTVALLGFGALVNGLVLNLISRSTHDISVSVTVSQAALILEVVLGAGALLWVRAMIGPARTAFLFGLGLLASVSIRGLDHDDPWKISLFLPVTLCVLGWTWWRRRDGLDLAGLVALAVVSALNDSRSAASILATAFLVLAWQRIRATLKLRSGGLRVVLDIAMIGLLTYFVMISFILDGYLGEGAKVRTEAQIRSAGALLLGGRPEIGATIALLRAQPLGYGMGVVPNFGDIYRAKSGMESINYNPNNGYVENYMFGGAIEVHSVIGDLWLMCGLFGLAFALAAIVVILHGSIVRLGSGRGRALTTALAIQVAWDAFFSPFYTTAALVLMLSIALLADDKVSKPSTAGITPSAVT